MSRSVADSMYKVHHSHIVWQSLCYPSYIKETEVFFQFFIVITLTLFCFSLREERDSEYAHMIQEEIQRRAEEALRREVEDEVCNTLQAQ